MTKREDHESTSAEGWTALGGDIARALAQVDEIDLAPLSPEQREKVEAARAELQQALDLYRALMSEFAELLASS